MATSTGTDLTSFEQFLEMCSEEYEQTQRGLKEMELLIQQTTGEVKRLAQRNTQATNRLRQVEASLNTASRESIQEAYATVMDTQQRLFTMRGQLEKLQSDQRNTVRYRDLLHGIIEATDQPKDDSGASEDTESMQQPVVRIIEAQERERHRLSRQIHDGPAQSLTNLVLQAEICERLFDVDVERARAELTDLKESVTSTFKKVRGFIMTLRPMMLDDLGLVPTLRRYVETVAENSGMLVHLTVTGNERRLASYKEVTTFRVIQDLLTNAHEHSHASSVQVSLDMGEERVRASVEDDGDGFELTEALASPEAEQLGLATMRERVEMLGGQMHFDSDLGQGTKIDFELPVSDAS